MDSLKLQKVLILMSKTLRMIIKDRKPYKIYQRKQKRKKHKFREIR